MIADGKINLLVSTVVCVEVLDQAETVDADANEAGMKFRRYVKRPNVVLANLDMRVAERAALIRERAVAAIKAGEIDRGIKAPDAIIAATASVYRADVLHTFDPDLLDLSESPIVDGLKITTPALRIINRFSSNWVSNPSPPPPRTG